MLYADDVKAYAPELELSDASLTNHRLASASAWVAKQVGDEDIPVDAQNAAAAAYAIYLIMTVKQAAKGALTGYDEGEISFDYAEPSDPSAWLKMAYGELEAEGLEPKRVSTAVSGAVDVKVRF